MQTQREFDATIRVLKALRTPKSATIVLTWDDDMQRAYISLSKPWNDYVRTRGGGSRSGPFKWNEIEMTDKGRAYLDSIEAVQKKGR